MSIDGLAIRAPENLRHLRNLRISLSVCLLPRRVALVGISAALWIVISCRGTTPMPDPIRPAEDNCAHCRMQVSQQRFAAEILKLDGTYIKFDDIGCFRSYLKSDQSLAGAPGWVMDFERSVWIDAKSAIYAVGAKEQTPMGSGILAFSERDSAARNGPNVASYDEMIHAASN